MFCIRTFLSHSKKEFVVSAMQHGCPAKPLLKLKEEWKERNYILERGTCTRLTLAPRKGT